jgi:hypothetical protein
MSFPVELWKSLLAALVLATLTTGTVAAGDSAWQSKSPSQWTVDDALEILRDSAWAHEENVLISRGASAFTSRGRLRQRPSGNLFGGWASYLVRWESSRPVMQAFERLDELGEQTSALHQGRPPQHSGEYYVVTVKSIRLPRSGYDFLESLGDENLLRLARLRTVGLTVKPVRLERSGMGASAALHFYFPVSVEGQALLRRSRQEVELSVKANRFELTSKFKLERRWIPQTGNGS